MPHDAYKYEIFSGDGQTFIRAGQYNIPRVTADGQYYYQASGQSYTTAADVVAWLNLTRVRGDVAMDFWTVNNTTDATQKISAAGFYRIVDPRTAYGLNAVNKSVRFKFKNGSYIVIKCTAYDAYQFGYEAKYYTQSGALQYTYTYSTSTTGGMWVPLPFVYRNLDGSITDYKARGFKGPGLSFDDYATYGVRFNTSGYDYYPFEDSTSLQAWFTGIEPIDENDPYPDVPNSEPSGPSEGVGIPSSDPVSIPNLPTVSLLDTGFVTLFNPSMADIKNLADYMWNNNAFDLANFKKIFANPMDCILGLNMVPVTVPATGAASINIGNLTTSVSIPRAASQWQELDCGTLDLGLPLGNYMDYAPNSKYSIYLPYIGIQELSTDDVAGKALTLKYHVDLMSCACIAYLKCGDSVLYQFSGSCGYPIPVTENSWNNLYKAIAELAVGVGGAVATGGMSAGGLMNGAVDLIQGLKPEIHRSGAIGSAAGLMGIQKPFLIIEIPNLCKPEKQYHYIGYPSFVTKKLNDISGFASFEEIILENIPCTEEEAVMIKNLCKGGIHL